MKENKITLNLKKKRLDFNIKYDYRILFSKKGIELKWDKEDKILTLPIKQVYLMREVLLELIKKLDIQVEEKIKDFLENFDYSKINKSKELITEEDILNLIPPNKKLYPFQQEGIKYLLERKHSLLGDELGLGKTIQALIFLNYKQEKKFPVLIVCPSNIVYNWKFQALEWVLNLKEEEMNIITAKEKELHKNKKIYIISYDLLSKYISKTVKKDKERYKRGTLKRKVKSLKYYLDDINFKTVIIDEAHYLQNLRSKRTKAINCDTIKKAEYKILITGTPIMNRPINMYSLLKFIAPNLFCSINAYGKRYCGARFNGFGIVYDGATNLEELHQKIKPFLIRRKKDEVLKELPEKTRSLILLDASNEEEFKRLSETTKADIKTIYKENGEQITLKIRDLMFQKIEEMRQKLFEFKKFHCYEFLLNKLEETDKIIVFAYHQQVISELEEFLKQQNIKSVKLTGGMSAEEKREVQQKFQNDPEIKVFIGSIRAAGVGIDLFASSTVIFFELDWVPANIIQAEDRAHRIGQKNNVNIYYLLLNDSIEVKMLKIIEKKAFIIEQVIEGKDKEEAKQSVDALFDEFILEIIKEK